MKNITNRSLLILIVLIFFANQASAQQPAGYPKIAGYFSILNPVGSWNKTGYTSNFGNVYTLVFPFGINVLKSDNFGVSFEVAPIVRTEKNISRVSSVLFHPGAMFRYKHGFTFIGRIAFETNGRFGVTPVFNKIVMKRKDASFFVSVPVPIRFGNDLPTSVSTGLQLGVLF